MSTTDGGDVGGLGFGVSQPPDDVVITTVVSSEDPGAPPPRPAMPERPEDDDLFDMTDLVWGPGDSDDLAEPLPTPAPEPVAEAPPSPPPPPEPRPGPAPTPGPEAPAGMVERVEALEALPDRLEVFGKAMRHELERCSSVLFAHDRALGTLVARLDTADAARAADGQAAGGIAEALTRLAEFVDRLGQRVEAAEARVEPLEPLPTVVQALRRAVRASDDLITGETAARDQALLALAGEQAAEAQVRDDALRRLVAQDLDRVSAVSSAQAKGLADLAQRVATAETRLTPLDTVPDDIAALSRILRRELDAVVADNQARDQMLRRALQHEVDQLRATSEAREALAVELAARLEVLETRSSEAAVAADAALGTAGSRLEALELRIAAVDRLTTDLSGLRDGIGKELDQLKSGGHTHDQLAGELTRRVSALDGRLARLDPVPGEVQSLRTAMLQEAERTVTAVRAADERIGQLSWVPAEFQEARKRIMALTSGLQASQDRVRQLEGALASTNERLDALRARLSSAVPPGPPG